MSQPPTHVEIAPQRRQVTVLFLDVASSTALTSRLDPEDVLEVMDGALKSFSAVVEAHGGRVLQYAGDSLLAAFGAERAQEDDAERAVHAGLALLAAAREQAARVQRAFRFEGFDIRVGIHTGHVLLGGGVDAEGTIRGFTVNIAARLEQTAPPGAVRISHDTWRQVRGAFEAEVQPPLTVKGHDEPLVTYLVRRAQPRALRSSGRGLEGVDGGYVGRAAELAALVDAFDRAAATRTLQVVTVLAEAGLGKSRHLYEAERRLRARTPPARVLAARSHPGSQQQPYGLVRDLLARELQIADSDSGETARGRLVAGLEPFFPPDGDTDGLQPIELLGQLVGMDFSASPRLAASLRDPRLLRDGALAAVATWLQRLAAQEGGPVVLLLDDLQWADDASLDWLDAWRKRADLPLVLILAARPELLERRPDWAAPSDRHANLALAPLEADARRALVHGLLQRLDAIPPELESLVDGQAEGNPYYAEELVQMLIDVGVIDTSGERWRVRPEHLVAARVPGTLVGVLQARLDALASGERRALQAASIVGPVFWDDALGTVEAGATAALPSLQRKAMVEAQRESTFEGTEEERFHHHLLHQVTYDTLLRNERRAGHATVAGWLAARVGERMDEYLALTAEHYARAGDAAHAIEWLERAGVAAQRRYANATALATFSRILAMPELADPRRRFDVLAWQAEVADLVGDRELQAAAHARQAEIADASGDDRMRTESLVNLALLADRLGHVREAEDLATRGAHLAEQTQDARSAALAFGELGWLQHQRREYTAAEATTRIALNWARRIPGGPTGGHITQAQLLTLLAIVVMDLHDYEGALDALQEALALSEAKHETRSAVSSHQYIAIVARRLGDLPRARRHVEAMATCARQCGLALLMAGVPGKLAALAFDEGRYAEAAEGARASGEAMLRMQNHTTAGDDFMLAAAACALMGDLAQARALLAQAIESNEVLGLKHELRECRIRIADTWRAEGDTARALALLEPEMAALEPAGSGAERNDDDATGSVGAAVAPEPDPVAIGARMAAWRILSAASDPRAARQLELAWAALQRTVSRVRDPAVKARMLAVGPAERELVAAWSARSGAA
jgi:class 3 adenylate cyclase/predicted ATPase